MADETEVSTPENTQDVNTSANELTPDTNQDVNTPDAELTPDDVAAETGNTEPNTDKKLFADKYSSPEELEKGYKELNKEFTQLKQQQSKYNELLERQKAQDLLNLEQARKNGYGSIEEQEIAQTVIAEEFNAFANGLNMIAPEYIEQVRQNLLNYYNTANRAYLDEAKRYFPSDFIEKIALGKQQLINQLQNDYETKTRKTFDEQEQKLANVIRNDYAEFLTDIKENEGKAQALKMFCNGGFIQSKEDMQVFIDIYGKIEQKAKENAIKEYQAQKAIEQTKAKAVIDSTTSPLDLNRKYTSADIDRMTQKQFDDYCNKHGTDWIYAK